MIWSILHCLVLEIWLGEGGNEGMTDNGDETPARKLGSSGQGSLWWRASTPQPGKWVHLLRTAQREGLRFISLEGLCMGALSGCMEGESAIVRCGTHESIINTHSWTSRTHSWLCYFEPYLGEEFTISMGLRLWDPWHGCAQCTFIQDFIHFPQWFECVALKTWFGNLTPKQHVK